MDLLHELPGCEDTGAHHDRRLVGGYESPTGREVRALRGFALGIDGGLYSPFHHDDAPWADGVNTAACSETTRHEAPDPGCACGYHAYGSVAWGLWSGVLHQARAWAVVACSGRIVAGERGLRAERARVLAVWFDDHDGAVDATVRRRFAERYPQVLVHEDRDELLAALPLTELPGYVTLAPARTMPPQGALPPLLGSPEARRRGGRALTASPDPDVRPGLAPRRVLLLARLVLDAVAALVVVLALVRALHGQPVVLAALLTALAALTVIVGLGHPDPPSHPPGPPPPGGAPPAERTNRGEGAERRR